MTKLLRCWGGRPSTSLHAVSIAVILLSSSAAQAAGGRAKRSAAAREQAAKERAAKKACITGDVKAGIDILGDLYIDSDDPTYLYNQGRCYEQNRRLEDAIDRFREYLRKSPNASASEKADANAHITECEALLVKQTGRTTPLAEPAAASASIATNQPASATLAANNALPQTAAVVAPSVSSEPRGRALRVAGIVTTIAGLCAVGTGVVLAIKERSLTNEINTKFSRSKESTRASYETWGYVSYGVGAAAVVGGATLYYLGWRAGKAAPAGIALLPALAPDAMTLVVQGSF